MRHRFDQFDLDTDQFQLRAHGKPVHVEPLVFDLLAFFVGHAGQVVSRDAIVARVWKGRFVSDATVASGIKAARRALGDSGARQTYVRTVRGRGFQFCADVASAPEGDARSVRSSDCELFQHEPTLRSQCASPPSIAVLPFFPCSPDPYLAVLGDALAQDVILELSRLHWLFVIARGSSFRFRGQEVDLARAGEVLGAEYLVTGTIMQQARGYTVAVELCRAAERRVVWADRFELPADEIMHLRTTLAGQIAAALEPRIQVCEALAAGNIPTERLDAWAAYHRGLRHMYRFNHQDNTAATHLFEHAVALDPNFARAWAGLSFTHFQNAFLGFSVDQTAETRQACAHAETCLELDPVDPLVNLTVGRAKWLSGDLDASLPWIERAIGLCPNYAFAIYNGALVATLLGDGATNEQRIAKAIALSPIDPLNYAMLATRALTHSVRGNLEEAALWSERAVQSPNAHVQIYTLAAITLELIGNRSKADGYVEHIRRSHPHYTARDFTARFPFRPDAMRRQVAESLRRLGL